MENPSIQISGKVSTSDSTVPLTFKIVLDGQVVYELAHVNADTEFAISVSDADDSEHELQFVMSGKQQQHTQIDDQGNIIKDAMLSISDLCFDEIDISQILIENAVYTHNFNGTQPEIQDEFFGNIGCNGTVSLKFTTPVYLWLLEKM